MAGRRRQAGRPLLRHVKAERARARTADRLAKAQGAQQRLAVAIDHARARLGTAPAPAEAAALAERLSAAAEELVVARYRQRLAAELAAATEPRDQIAVAARVLRAAAGPAPTGRTAEIAEALVRELTEDLHTPPTRKGGLAR